MLTAELDMSNFNFQMERWRDELGVDSPKVLKHEIPLLMQELVRSVPPRKKPGLEAKIAKDIGKVFWNRGSGDVAGGEMGRMTANNIDFDHAGKGSMRWLQARTNRLLGVNVSDLRLNMSAGEMAALYAQHPDRGSKYIELGQRGRQSVKRINRLVVRADVFRQFLKIQISKVGKMKASFAAAWATHGPKTKLPAWIRRHIDKGTAPGSFSDDTRAFFFPKFTIISRAPGVSRPEIIQIVQRALDRRARSMKYNIRLYLVGKKRIEDTFN